MSLVVAALASLSWAWPPGPGAVEHPIPTWTSHELTPWPKPTEGNALVTEGAFGLCRHPIYSGLLLASVGFAFVTQSFERLLVSGALLWLLNKKAAKEEGMLRERHGKAFDAWAKRVPRFIPRLDELIDAFLAARGKSS